MKTKYIAPAVESVNMEAEKMLAESGLTGNNQLGDGEQLSKEQDFFDADSLLNKYIPNQFPYVFPRDDE